MSDPAVDAAQRATQPHGIPWAVGPGRYALHGAREALAPIRELHRPDDSAVCAECDMWWPCSTARLVYTTDELKETQ